MEKMTAADKNCSMFLTMLELILKEQVIEISESDDFDHVNFLTISGMHGSADLNYYNKGWDVFLEDEIIYEIEETLGPILQHTDNKELFNLYAYIKKINVADLQETSAMFKKIVHDTITGIFIKGNLDITGQAQINMIETIYKNNRKVVLFMN